MPDNVAIRVRRSHLGRVRGTGSAKAGVHHWYAERVTAIALVPLTVWFVFGMLALVGAPREAVVDWVGRPWNTALLLALVIMTFHHLHLGVQVILEDYVHTNSRWVVSLSIMAVRAICGVLGLLAGVAVLKMALS